MNTKDFLFMFEMHLSILLTANPFNIGFYSKTIRLDARETLLKAAKIAKMDEKQIAQRIVDIVRNKNKDYADESDAFKNFRLSEKELGVSVDKAIKIRMLDKISRIDNLEEGKQNSVEDEKLEDTYIDLVAYMVIEHIYSNPQLFKVL